MTNVDIKKFVDKVRNLSAKGNFDLSLEEDLSIAIMNLISLEEHFFFTAEKTGEKKYLDYLGQVREVRKKLLAKMIVETEGETWCIAKHLLATTMRLIEVGTKYQTDGKTKESEETFSQAYEIYSLFWAVRLQVVKSTELRSAEKSESKDGWTTQDLVAKLVDCCKE